MYLHAEVCKREGKRVRERGHPCDKARLELGRRPLLVKTFLLAYGMKWRCLLHILPQLLFLFPSHSLLFFFLRFFVDFTSPSKNMKYTTNNLLPSVCVCVCCRSWTGSNGEGSCGVWDSEVDIVNTLNSSWHMAFDCVSPLGEKPLWAHITLLCPEKMNQGQAHGPLPMRQ